MKRTRLVYCDLRNSANYTKILYLVINTVPKKFKKKKSYRTWYVRKTSSGLKYSQFRNAHLSLAVNLLYLDLPKLKQQVSAKLLPLSKQKVNNVFYTKTRYKSWINFLAKIKGIRNTKKFYIKNKSLNFAPINFHNLNIEQSLNFKLKRLKNQIIVLNRFFSTLKKQKTLTKQNIILYKTQLTKLKTKFAKLNATISKFNLNTNDFTYKSKNLKTVHHKNSLYLNRRAHAKTINKTIRRNNLKQKSVKKLISKKLLNKRLTSAKKILAASDRVSLKNYKRWVLAATISRIKKKQFLLNINESRTSRFSEKNITSLKLNRKSSRYYTSLNLQNKHTKLKLSPRKSKIHAKFKSKLYIKKAIKIKKRKKTLKPAILNTKVHQQLVLNSVSAYIDYLKTTNRLNSYRTFTKFFNLLSSLNSKYQLKRFKVRFPKTFVKISQTLFTNKNINQILNYPTSIKTVKLATKFRARRGGRTKFAFALLRRLRIKKKLSTTTRTLLKSKTNDTVDTKNVFALVKNFEKGYKQLIKKNNKNKKKKTTVWKLRESFRNTYKRHTETLIKYQYKLGLQKILLNYFKMNFEVKITRPLAQFKNLKFLRLVYPIRNFQRKSATLEVLFKKTLRKLSVKENTGKNINNNKKANTIISLRKRYILMGNRSKRFAKVNSISTNVHKKNTYVFKKKANIFKRLRRQELLNFTQQRLKDVRRKLMIRSFVPIASLFIKYLNPQLLADHIAKEFERTKHHQGIIFGLSQALRSLPFARAKGYRIAIAGRINSASKSRSYLLKRNVLVRQDFSKKVNFASSQARARIGSFGIKVWIFY